MAIQNDFASSLFSIEIPQNPPRNLIKSRLMEPERYRRCEELKEWMGLSKSLDFSEVIKGSLNYDQALVDYAGLQLRSDSRYEKRRPKYRHLWTGKGTEKITRVLYDG